MYFSPQVCSLFLLYFKDLFILVMCISGLPTCMTVHQMYAGAHRCQEGTETSGTEG